MTRAAPMGAAFLQLPCGWVAAPQDCGCTDRQKPARAEPSQNGGAVTASAPRLPIVCPGPACTKAWVRNIVVGWPEKFGRQPYESPTQKPPAGRSDPALIGQDQQRLGQDDNGGSMKGATMKVTMERLGVTASFSRPRVSNDNPFSKALFRTCKYTPNWPPRGFETSEEARIWVQSFANWYNQEHRHSAILFVTPDQRHRGEDRELLANRHQVYELTHNDHPERWSGPTRNW